MRTAAIIAAAGIGRRMESSSPKQYLKIGGRPIIYHTLSRFAEVSVDEVIISVEPERVNLFQANILDEYNFPKSWRVVEGGDMRQQSVSNALRAVPEDTDVVVIHDGVRPFVKLAQIEKAIEVARLRGACIVASPIKETVKKVGERGLIVETVDRTSLWGAQTPQAFRYGIIKNAMELAIEDGFVGTDEASLVERMGVEVEVVAGDSRNIKITTPGDIAIAEAILKEWKAN